MGIGRGLSIRHDHGSQYMSDAFQQELAFLGIASSPAFVRAPEGNGCAERFIRTLKENLLWVHTFDTVEELRQALLVFRRSTTQAGSSNGTGSRHLPPCGRTSFHPRYWPRSMQSGVSLIAGGTPVLKIRPVLYRA